MQSNNRALSAEVYPLQALYYIGEPSHILRGPSVCKRFCTLWENPPKEMAVDRVTQAVQEGILALEEASKSDADLRRWEQIGRSGSGQTVAYCKSGCGGSVLAVRLIEDVREVMNHRFLADDQFLGNLAIALAAANQLEYCNLAWGQAGW
jgi:hypothetical protein